MECRQVLFSNHARKRLFERSISIDEAMEVIQKGETIEDYPGDKPFPSKLLLGLVKQKPLHIVMAMDEATKTCIVVTVYPPDLQVWGLDFKRRKS
jgi:hypothetical protein